MESIRVNVPLSQAEAQALVVAAQAACRHPREQARFLIREALVDVGLLREERGLAANGKETVSVNKP
jgi:hypothetical protein